jgi:hypothetical protein
LGERLLCKQEVIGSIPFTSTNWAPSTTGATVLHRGTSTTGEAQLRRATGVASATLQATRLGEEHATPLRGDPRRGLIEA